MIGRTLARALAPSPVLIERPKAANYDSTLVPNINTGMWYGDMHRGTYGFTYSQLEIIARKPLLGDPARKLNAKIAAMCRPVARAEDPGWWIRHYDTTREMTPAARQRAREIQAVILNAGGPFQMPPTASHRGSMAMAMRMWMRDSLMYDQATFEVLRTYGGRIVGWLPQDARTFRLRNPTPEEMAARQRLPTDGPGIFRQIDSTGTPLREFDASEICWFIRRPRTDERFLGYGYPEYDEGCEVGSGVLKTWKSNDVKFDNGIHAAILVLVRSMMMNDPTAFDDFKRDMMGMLSGVNNTGRAVIAGVQPGMWQGVGPEDIDIKPIGPNNQEMEFSQWLHMGIRGLANLWNMDASEFGYSYGNEGQTGGLNGSDPEAKLLASNRTGFWPLLDDIAAAFNGSIVWQIDPDFFMEFCGRGDPTAELQQRLELAAVQTYTSPNYLRKIKGLEPIPLKEADVPLALAQYLSPQATTSGAYQLGGGILTGALPAGRELPGPRLGPLDGAMKGTSVYDVDGWTQRFTEALHADRRVRLEDRGAGRKAWVVDVSA